MSTRVFSATNILLPKTDDMAAWAVIACDQHTSEPEYWSKVEEIVGEHPSALRLILPEAYLGDDEVDKQISDINRHMEEYKEEGLFREYPNSYCYVERSLSNGRTRHGLIGVIDLEQYDCSPDSHTLVRPTEGTIQDRLPPRIKVRERAPLELTHILVLINDPDRQVVEPVTADRESLEELYDFDLMQHGGHIRGWSVRNGMKDKVDQAFDHLYQQVMAQADGEADPLIIAMGDGNHSFATAKACWERIRETIPEEQWEDHPARYALVELVNIYDEGMEFEPIHRTVFGVEPDAFIRALYERFDICEDGRGQIFEYVTGGQRKKVGILNPTAQLATGTIQDFIEDYIAEHGGSVDYIHGEDVVEHLCQEAGTVGIIFPEFNKDSFFASLTIDGPMPKKTFSIGSADDKRFYLEARRIC